ncbi:MAG TPA: HAD-IIIA family hydrolase [Acidobacteriaceae bacterium]|jgi:D-glycero-D-manno-heptose 1,7-bisphosphate phosphatase|nr:HAD-IIIA family hydrolase [Acidobacteriaceae bacterium]
MGVSGLSQPAAVFLDRDGVINRNVMNPLTLAWEAPLTVESFVLANNALQALRALQKAGFLLFVVSNQPNCAKAKASFETLKDIHNHLLHLLHEEQIEFAAFYYCLHHPHGVRPGYSGSCRCRKPSPFFLLQARDQFGLDMEHSWMVGDRASDIACGQAAGVHTILVHNQEEDGAPVDGDETGAEFQVDSLEGAAAIILGARRNSLT